METSSILSLSSSSIEISVNGVLSCSELIRWKITSNIGVFLRFLTSLRTTGITFAVILSPGRCLLTWSPSIRTMPLLGCAPLGTYSGCSWISIHWLFTIRELISIRSNLVCALGSPQPSPSGHFRGSLSSRSFSWSTSISTPHDSHLKTAL